LTYDSVSFLRHLDIVRAAESPALGETRQTHSPWLFLDAAHTIFDTAKRRVYTGDQKKSRSQESSSSSSDSLRPILEEQPKWAVLADIVEEIDRDLYFNPMIRDDSNGTILIMCTDHRTCHQIREYLDTKDVPLGKESPEEIEKEEASALYMMRKKLRNYIRSKDELAKLAASLFEETPKDLNSLTDTRNGGSFRGKAPPNKRRRIRGGAAAALGSSRNEGVGSKDTSEQIANLVAEPSEYEKQQQLEQKQDSIEDMEDYFGMLDMKDVVIVHPYDGDHDEHLLEEVKPSYVIMYEPDAAFIRRVEVYRSSHNHRNVKVYFMYYGGSVEEQRYLSAVRREKDAFTNLIREKGVGNSSRANRRWLTTTTDYGCYIDD
jgi:DNA excision repair protein ERCC-4